jgi:membrane fusion protein (multidrug efflux system)
MPPDVLVMEVMSEAVPIYDDFVGTLEPSVSASIQARVQGYLTSQNYEEGRPVKKGDLLFQINPVPFEVALTQAKAALAQAEASAKQAEMIAQRNAELFARKTISELERDNATLQSAAAKANVDVQRATVRQAQVSLDYASVKSPIDGVAGFARAQVGDLVGPTTGVLATVSTVDPIKANFTVPDQRYVSYTQRWLDNPKARAEHERQLEFELILANGSLYPHKGRLFAVDNDVDMRTGVQRIATSFPNPGNILRGGQFGRVRMRAEIRQGAVLVPQRAVTDLQGLYQVVVVGAENKAEIRPVKMGRRVEQRWIVEEGLKPGERIVVEGTQKATQGTVVNPKPWRPSPPSAMHTPGAAAPAATGAATPGPAGPNR